MLSYTTMDGVTIPTLHVDPRFLKLYPVLLADGKKISSFSWVGNDDSVIPVLIGSTLAKTFAVGHVYAVRVQLAAMVESDRHFYWTIHVDDDYAHASAATV